MYLWTRCLLFVMTMMLVPSAYAQTTTPKASPWFLWGPNAAPLLKQVPEGWSVRVNLNLGITPSRQKTEGFDTYFRTANTLQWSPGHLLFNGFTAFEGRLPLGGLLPTTAGQKDTPAYFDQGSSIEVIYGWQGSRGSVFQRKVGIRLLPFSSVPMFVGHQLEGLWRIGHPGKPSPSGQLLFEWDWIKVDLALTFTPWPHISNTPALVEDLWHPSLLGRVELAPIKQIKAWVHGAFGLKGKLGRADAKDQQTGGLHGGIIGWLGERPKEIEFLHRRRLDPSAAQRPLAWSPSKGQMGLAVRAELGYRTKDVFDPTLQSSFTTLHAFTTTLKVIGQWRWFQMELAYTYQSYQWISFDDGFTSMEAILPSTKVSGMSLLSTSLQIVPSSYVSFGWRGELRLPAQYDGIIPPSLVGQLSRRRLNQITYVPGQFMSLASPNRQWSVLMALQAKVELRPTLAFVVEGALMYEPNRSPLFPSGVSQITWGGSLLALLQGRY